MKLEITKNKDKSKVIYIAKYTISNKKIIVMKKEVEITNF
jgi:hypothetical protein